MIKSLNALRVLAEFWVVHQHLSGIPINRSFDAFITSLMSFFFVLSGFVITHAHKNDDLSSFESKKLFWMHRFSKVYPVFLFFWVLDFVNQAGSGELTHNPRLLPCSGLQLFMLNGWVGCRTDLANAPSWYITTLAWFWFVFPWLHPVLNRFATCWPWTQMIVLNAVSFSIVAAMFPLGYWIYAPLPAVRIFEFYIGCVAAKTVETRLHWAWPLGAATLLFVFYVSMFYTAVLVPNICEGGEWSFLESVPFTDYCLLDWAYMTTTKFAVVWAVFIQWFAASELHNVPGRTFQFLEDSPLLQTMNTFSLQLYLGHITFFKLLMGLAMHMKFNSQLGLHTIFIIVYGLSYSMKLYVQPYLDQIASPKQPFVELQETEVLLQE